MSDDGYVAVPMDIECSELVFDVDFHPSGNFLAAGCIDGHVEVWKHEVGHDANKRVLINNPHDGSCRGLAFDGSGQRLWTICSDKFFRVMDEYGKEMNRFHTGDDKLNKMLRLDDNTVITGDDSGCVKVWDLRIDNNKLVSSAAMEWHVHEDYVSSFLHVPDQNNTLLSGSGDGTLAIYDLRKPSAENTVRSEDQEAEITCIEVMKHGKKVVCGTQDGVMLIFSWGKWMDQSDRYPGHPETVDCSVKIDERTLLTGSSDGLIRALQVQPNKLLGVLGSHEDFPVEGMKKNHDDTLIASFAHDPIIRFNDVSIFYEGGDEDEEDDGEREMDEDHDDADGLGSDPRAMDSASDEDSDDDVAGGGPAIPKMKTAAESFFEDM